MSDEQIPHLQLFVKRSLMDNSHKSSCPICQRWFMVLFLKSEAKELALTVFPVNMKNPEPEFKEYHAQPPVVVLAKENVVLTDNLRIEHYINSRFTSLDLTSDKEAENVTSDVYIKFNAYLKATDDAYVKSKEKLLRQELRRINDFLEQRGTKYLSGDEMTLVDCDLMPKLQHIRIAGKAYRNFEIPEHLVYLWQYMSTCYETKAFKESCPYDQDIILHYEGKVPLKPLGKNPTLQRPTTTLTIPINVIQSKAVVEEARSAQMSPINNHNENDNSENDYIAPQIKANGSFLNESANGSTHEDADNESTNCEDELNHD